MIFVQGHGGDLRRIPLGFFLTCSELTRVPNEDGRESSIYLDLSLGRPPRFAGELNRWERGHLLSAFLAPVRRKAPQVRPVGIGVFSARLAYGEADFPRRVSLRLL